MAKIHIYTQGCTANQADSEVVAGLLKAAGHELTNLANSELVIFNTCSLKTPTEQSLFRKIQDTKNLKIRGFPTKVGNISKTKKVIVAGCFPLSFEENKRLKKYSLVGSFDLKKIVEAVKQTLAGERVVLLSRTAEEKLCLPRIRDDKKIAKIVISKGCLGNCAFCSGKKARGKLVSYNIEEIVEEAKQAISEGCNRIYLTSQDCGCWGFDRGTDIVELLKQVLDLKGNFKVRLGMANPNHIYKLLTKLIPIYKHPKMLKFLHIPIQSGSDKVLKAMNRRYDIAQFKAIVSKFRKQIPNISIATDIIVGFPGETKEDFQETVEILNWLKPEVLNFTKYWPRQGTIAGDKYLKSITNPNSTKAKSDAKIKQVRAKTIYKIHEIIKKKKQKGAPPI
jgi:threonylcarbamoyladenosine tRNA methylthiotransferase CDKAL1